MRKCVSSVMLSLVLSLSPGFVDAEVDIIPVGEPDFAYSGMVLIMLSTVLPHDPALAPVVQGAKAQFDAYLSTYQASGQMHGIGRSSTFLLNAYELTGDPSWLETAKRQAHWLMSNAIIEHGGYYWPDSLGHPDRIVVDFNHGNGGMAYFFTRMYRATGDPVYKKYALGSATWMKAMSIQDEAGRVKWYWHTVEGPFRTGDCTGAAGMAVMFYRMYLTFGDGWLKEMADGALDWLESVGKKETTGMSWTLERVDEAQMHSDIQWPRKGKGVYTIISRGKGTAGIGRAFALGSLINQGVLIHRSRSRLSGYMSVNKGTRGRDLQRAARYRKYAEMATDYVLSTADWDGTDRCSWEDTKAYYGPDSLVHYARKRMAPCSGTGGVGQAIANVWQVTGNPEYEQYALAQGRWLVKNFKRDGPYAWWNPSNMAMLPVKNMVPLPLLSLGEIYHQQAFIDLAKAAARTLAAAKVHVGNGYAWTKYIKIRNPKDE